MGSVTRYMVVVVFALLMCGCGVLDTSSDDDEGYLLRSEEEGPSVGVMYGKYKVGGQPNTMTGYMHTAYPSENPEGAYFFTTRITGSVDGSRIFIQLENNPQAEYVGSVEGDTMELRRGLAEWTGEAATYGDFGEAAAEMEEAAKEGNFVD